MKKNNRVYISLMIIVMSLASVLGLYVDMVWSGQKPIPSFVVGWLIEWEQSKNGDLPLGMADSLFLDDFTYAAANDMLKAMSEVDECKFENYVFNDIGTAHKVYLALGYEILNGRSSKILCWHVNGGYVLGWERGNEVAAQHKIASAYINVIWSQIEEMISCLDSEKEKADFIADYIIGNVVKEYDMSLANGTIYDTYISGTESGVCNVFATLFDRLCEKAGIECYVMVGYSQEITHAWNKLVFSDGSVHYYDLTYYVTSKDMGFKDMNEIYYTFGSYQPVEYNAENGYGFGCYKLQ